MESKSPPTEFIKYDDMIMNSQAISVALDSKLLAEIQSLYDLDNLSWEHPNVYILKIDATGEKSQLTSEDKQFIFKKEMELFEADYEINIPFNESWFDSYFKITWHGVIYHVPIKP